MDPVLLLAAAMTPAAEAPAAQDEAALGEGVRAMIEAAIASGDAKAAETMLRFARQTHGGAKAEIDAIETAWRARLAEAEAVKTAEKREEIESAGLFEQWKGQVELGASRSTGRSDNLGVYTALGFQREGIDWRHNVAARAELQRSRGVSTTERVFASWQPNYKIGRRLYGYGLGQYEYDPIQGFDGRYTAGGGLGYQLVDAGPTRLEVEGGPAFRHTDRVGLDGHSNLATRASVNFRWTIAPELELKQTSALYLERGDSNASALTTLDARLFGPLKARFSYDVRYESGEGGAADSLDTQSRVTLVYSF
ncbi:MAG: YdiY family protein [Allosphingosinicella sp.]